MTIYISHNYSQASVAIGWEQSGTNLQSPALFVRSNGIQWKSFHYGNENFCFLYGINFTSLMYTAILLVLLHPLQLIQGKIIHFSLNYLKRSEKCPVL